ncbi:hypothetical protein AGMMS49944_22230 [Spirochaetia bacterium]|nr:hypothetical protein AGMMS49944_22230 [Spirochaetia bacterium]
MKLEKQNYYNLLDDDFTYKAHKEKIDEYIKKELEAKEIKKQREKMPDGVLSQSELDELLTAERAVEYLPSPKEIEISDSEYENLKQHSEWLNEYEGSYGLAAFGFESYRDQYEEEKQKNHKLRRVVERLMERSVQDIDDKTRILLDLLLE